MFTCAQRTLPSTSKRPGEKHLEQCDRDQRDRGKRQQPLHGEQDSAPCAVRMHARQGESDGECGEQRERPPRE